MEARERLIKELEQSARRAQQARHKKTRKTKSRATFGSSFFSFCIENGTLLSFVRYQVILILLLRYSPPDNARFMFASRVDDVVDLRGSMIRNILRFLQLAKKYVLRLWPNISSNKGGYGNLSAMPRNILPGARTPFRLSLYQWVKLKIGRTLFLATAAAVVACGSLDQWNKARLRQTCSERRVIRRVTSCACPLVLVCWCQNMMLAHRYHSLHLSAFCPISYLNFVSPCAAFVGISDT